MSTPAAIRVEHPSIAPYGYADGFLTEAGLFITRRPGSHLYDVWVSVEAFTVSRDEPAALLAGNLPLDDALAVAA